MFLSTSHSQYNAITNHLKCPLSFGLSARDEIIHSEWRHPSCIWQPKSQRPCMQNGFPTLFPDEELQDDWLLANKSVSLIFLLSHIQVCTQVCACKSANADAWKNLGSPGQDRILGAYTECISCSHCRLSNQMCLPLSSDCHTNKSAPLRTQFWLTRVKGSLIQVAKEWKHCG